MWARLLVDVLINKNHVDKWPEYMAEKANTGAATMPAQVGQHF